MPIYNRWIPNVDIEIKKVDSGEIDDASNNQIYTLSVFNDTDSNICILFSFDLNESIKHQVFSLDPVYDCSNDTLKYYSLEHCQNWDIGYLPLPAKPFLLSPNSYLKTYFSIELTHDMPKEFHLHYANVDIKYSDIVKSYQNDMHYWERSLSIKCKRTPLPN